MINGLSNMISLLALDHSDLQEHYGRRVSHEGSLAKKTNNSPINLCFKWQLQNTKKVQAVLPIFNATPPNAADFLLRTLPRSLYSP